MIRMVIGLYRRAAARASDQRGNRFFGGASEHREGQAQQSAGRFEAGV